jgi:hypothetical protein
MFDFKIPLLLLSLLLTIVIVNANLDSFESTGRDVPYTSVVGKVFPPDSQLGSSTWQTETLVHLKGSPQRAYLRYMHLFF